MRASLFFGSCFLALVAWSAVALGADIESPADVQLNVVLDPAGQSGRADATIRIHATRETVWSLVTSCPESLNLVPGLVGCDVLETAPDQSWQKIRHVLDYSWFIPKLTYELHATYDKPEHVTVVRTSGDVKALSVEWTLRADGDYTIARYVIALEPGFWVPKWLVRVALRRDLPKMLLALRNRAETLQNR